MFVVEEEVLFGCEFYVVDVEGCFELVDGLVVYIELVY